jgi:CHAD domain-containing protein
MTKPRSLAGFTAALTVEDCLAQLIGFRLNEIAACEEGALKGSIDGIHDMRVSCRRLQAIFKAFRTDFHKKRIKKFRRALSALIQALGRVREYDVLLGHITATVKPSSDIGRTALGFLVSRYSLQRAGAHKKLVALLREFDDSKTLAGFRANIGRIFSGKAEVTASFLARLQHIVPAFFGVFLSSSIDVVNHPRRSEALHRLRISGKPLRYVMELSTPCFGPAYKQQYQDIKGAIELLGDIHDLDVTLGTLNMYLKEVRLFNVAAKTSSELPVRPGFLLATIKTLRQKRSELFVNLSSTMELWRIDRFSEKLIAAMQAQKQTR